MVTEKTKDIPKVPNEHLTQLQCIPSQRLVELRIFFQPLLPIYLHLHQKLSCKRCQHLTFQPTQVFHCLYLNVRKKSQIFCLLFLQNAVSKCFFKPVTQIWPQPIDFATKRHIKPIGPAPQINKLSPTETPALVHACIPTDIGSIIAASSQDTFCGNLD